MIKIDHTIQVAAPRESVFAVLSDVDGLARWQKGVIESKRLSEGEIRPGFQFEETARVGLWKLRNVCTVTEVKPHERFAFEARSSGPLDYEGSFQLQPVAGGTRLSVSGVARLKGPWKLLQPLLASDLRRELREEMAALKRIAEGQLSEPGHEAGRRRP